MAEIKFKKLKLTNFLSFGDKWQEISFSNGLHLCTGYNYELMSKNGCGKSVTCIDALIYVLFGKTLRKINKKNLPNKENDRECKVIIEFEKDDDDYKIKRGEKPKLCELYKNGEKKEQEGVRETQKKIDSILGVGKDVFTTLNVLSINYSTPFLQLSLQNKRDIIEKILSVEDIGDIFQSARNKHNELDKNINSLQQEVDNTREYLKELKNSYNNLSKRKKQHKKKILKKLKKIKKKTSKIKEERKNEKNKLKNEDDLKDKISNMEDKKEKLDEKISDKNGKKSKHKSIIEECNEHLTVINEEGQCPFCGINFQDEDAKEHIEDVKERKENSQSEIENLEEKIEEFQSEINDIDNNLKEHESNLQEIENAKIRIKNKNDKLQDLKEEKKETIKNKDNFGGIISEDKIDKYQNKLNKKEKQLESHENEFAYYDFIVNILGDEGIKQFIISEILPYLNKQMNEYLENFGVDFVCKFGPEMDAKIIKGGRFEYQYHNLSGGEQKRLDVAILLAFNDICYKQNNIHYNIQIFDEILDSSLDSDGIEELIDQLHNIAMEEDKSITLISHRTQLKELSESFDRIINVDKNNDGFSKIYYE